MFYHFRFVQQMIFPASHLPLCLAFTLSSSDNRPMTWMISIKIWKQFCKQIMLLSIAYYSYSRSFSTWNKVRDHWIEWGLIEKAGDGFYWARYWDVLGTELVIDHTPDISISMFIILCLGLSSFCLLVPVLHATETICIYSSNNV